MHPNRNAPINSHQSTATESQAELAQTKAELAMLQQSEERQKQRIGEDIISNVSVGAVLCRLAYLMNGLFFLERVFGE
jgi:hypothetical protein